ncbi:MAG: SBBP repeat-containing protein [Bacteroidia bacterium]|nr:SBBP repeat-containing protein [Bacteroidia bacterium]MCX7651837.1 SBBP repeat-containing protein [Bacteroidia bacterium]MDW8416013.1 SBBP repeat-containing protein [Bacteroidia bacterium]
MPQIILRMGPGLLGLLPVVAYSWHGFQTASRFFIQNKGQWTDEVMYMHHQPGLAAWITREGVVYDFYQLIPNASDNVSEMSELRRSRRAYRRVGHVLRVYHVGASASVRFIGQGPLSAHYNYLLGNAPHRWAAEVPLYSELTMENIYPGIAQRWYFDEGRLRYDYIITPGADPSAIRLRVEGAYGIQVVGNKLSLATRFGPVEICDLRAYQFIEGRKRAVPVRWETTGQEIRLITGTYDKRLPLIIDPYVWSHILGGGNADEAYNIALSAPNKLLVVGQTLSPTFPTTIGAYDTSHDGTDGFLSQLNRNTGALEYSTFIGGTFSDAVNAVAVGPSGELFLAGYTASTNFPTTPGSYRPTKPSVGGDKDAFILRLNANGTTLLYGTYIGGNSIDEARDVAVDASGRVYVTGYTQSSAASFPVTAGAYDNSLGGTSDAFLVKINPANGGIGDLIYGTYIGGSSSDESFCIAVDASGKAYVGGFTFSTNFPTVSGSFALTAGSGGSGFLVKINATGSALEYGTYIAGNNTTAVLDLAIDKNGIVYLTGNTAATNFPTTPGSYDGTVQPISKDAFVIKLDPNPNIPTTSQVKFSTVVGQTGDIRGEAIAIDTSGNIYVAGRAIGNDVVFPTTSNAISQVYNGNDDAIAFKLNPQGNQLLYSTFIGKENEDGAYAVAVDSSGGMYIAGFTESPNFPATIGAGYQSVSDAFVMRINIPTTPAHLLQESGRHERAWKVYPTIISQRTFWIENSMLHEGIFELRDIGGKQIHQWSLTPGIHQLKLPEVTAGVYIVRESMGHKAIQIVVE